MKKVASLLFVMVLAANIISSEFGFKWGVYLSKPFLMPLLGWKLLEVEWLRTRWVWFALFFSWAGDMLLMLPYDLFIFGLASFLLAHIFYIRHFWGCWDRKSTPLRMTYLVALLFYLIGLFSLLLPVLGDLRAPVLVYGSVISIMLLFAMHTRRPGYQIGAALFVLSDSILAINKFYMPLPLSSFWVMATYGGAQYFIVKTSHAGKFE